MHENQDSSDSYFMKGKKINETLLVRRIINGNERALNFFYNHFYSPLNSYIGKKIANPEDAEEILQDTFMATLDALRDFSFKSALFTFICSIANHKIIDFYRRKKIKKIVFSQFVDIEPLLVELFGPEEALNVQILKEKIKETLEKLSPSYSLILKLKYVQGYSVLEIAKLLSVSFKSRKPALPGAESFRCKFWWL